MEVFVWKSLDINSRKWRSEPSWKHGAWVIIKEIKVPGVWTQIFMLCLKNGKEAKMPGREWVKVWAFWDGCKGDEYNAEPEGHTPCSLRVQAEQEYTMYQESSPQTHSSPLPQYLSPRDAGIGHYSKFGSSLIRSHFSLFDFPEYITSDLSS